MQRLGFTDEEMLPLVEKYQRVYLQALAKTMAQDTDADVLRLERAALGSALVSVIEENNQKILADLRDAGVIR